MALSVILRCKGISRILPAACHLSTNSFRSHLEQKFKAKGSLYLIGGYLENSNFGRVQGLNVEIVHHLLLFSNNRV